MQTGEKIIIGNNGFFGDRLVAIAKSYGLEVMEVKAALGEALDPEDISKALKANPDAKIVAVVHSETSTTILNPIEAIGRVVKDSDALFMVDAVSSLGGVPIEVDGWFIDLCPSASQKCLGATPGLGAGFDQPKSLENDRQVRSESARLVHQPAGLARICPRLGRLASHAGDHAGEHRQRTACLAGAASGGGN